MPQKGFINVLMLIQSITCISAIIISGPNLIANFDFQLPIFNASFSSNSQYSQSIQGWNCSRKCKIVSLPYLCKFNNAYCSIENSNQVLDLQSSIQNQIVSQCFTLNNTSQILITFQWLPPMQYGFNKSFTVLFNNQTIFQSNTISRTTMPNNWQNVAISVNSSQIINCLQFQMSGPYDQHGYYIDNVTVRNILTQQNNITVDEQQSMEQQIQKFNSFVLQNRFTKAVNGIPGSRVFFRYVIGFYMNMDRLQFYYFHKKNQTDNSRNFLKKIYQFQEEKGETVNFIQQYFFSHSSLQLITKFQHFLISSYQFKKEYSFAYILTKNDNGTGFISNQINFITNSLPFSFLLYILFFIVFKITFNCKISKFFRKYSFYGIILFIIYEGNFIYYL